MARVLGLKQVLSKKFSYLPNLPEKIKASFGNLVDSFIMIIWGQSGNGKSNMTFDVVKALMPHGKVLYVSLEEGTEASIVETINRHFTLDEHSGKIEFADHEMTYDKLFAKLKKKKSPKFIVIDSVQYWDVTYEQYKQLKEAFKRKTFIFISHADGVNPMGSVAKKIRYDAPIKVHVDRYIAHVVCRYGGNQPYIIWEDGAKLKWGKDYQKAITGVADVKAKKAKKAKAKAEPPAEPVTHMQIADEAEKPVFKQTLKEIEKQAV